MPFAHIRRSASFVLPLLIALVVLNPAASIAAITQEVPSPEMEPVSSQGLWSPTWSNGPDEFGYTVADATLIPGFWDWIDATSGANTGLTGRNQQAGPFALPFTFKFYENAYDELYISTNGTIGFSGNLTMDSQEYSFPNPQEPNNVIAANWAPEDVSSGGVYYLSGGTAPYRWFAVEWYQVRDALPDSQLTFEIVLYENGSFDFRYLTINYGASVTRFTPGVGIEDARGMDGLYYNADYLWSGRVVYFTRPAPSARVALWPKTGGGALAPAGTTVRCKWTVSNSGELGPDTYDITAASTSPVQLMASDGITPLVDTDSDGAVDTGPVAQGAGTVVQAILHVPNEAQTGTFGTATLKFMSSINPTRSKTVTCQAAVAAPFAQAYNAGYNAMLLRLQHPAGGTESTVNSKWSGGLAATVAETPGYKFVYGWSANRQLPSSQVSVSEIEFAVMDQFGEIFRPAGRLTDHSTAVLHTFDRSMQMAAAPNGRVGMIWEQQEWDSVTAKGRYNLYFAILDPGGAPIFGPENLTRNSLWGAWNDLHVPRFQSPNITATDDNRFVFAWTQTHQEADGYVSDIYFAVRDTTGSEVHSATRYTMDAPGNVDGNGYTSTALAPMMSNQALLVWQGGATQDLFYAVLTSTGETVRTTAPLTADGTPSSANWQADAARMVGGNVVLAWPRGRDRDAVIRVAVLNASGDIIKLPFTLDNPVAPQGNTSVSVAPAGDKAVLTWGDGYYNYRFRLFYALLSEQGDIVTPPMILRNSETESSYLQPGNNTSYTWSPPNGVDGVASITPAQIIAQPGEEITLTVKYANRGAVIAQDVMLTASLGPGLIYIGDSLGTGGLNYGKPATDNQVTWQLPDLTYLSRDAFELYIQVSPDMPFGTTIPLDLILTAAADDVNPADNVVHSQLTVGHQIFLPLTLRSIG